MNLKENKGITLIALVMTVIILLILSGAMVYNSTNQIKIKKINDLKNDIQILSEKIEDYYIKYGSLPVLCDYTADNITTLKNKTDFQNLINQNASARSATISTEINKNDGDKYEVIDLERLDGISLNYGYDKNGEYFELKENPDISYTEKIETEIYVINTTTHQIYFPHGIFVDKVMYYTSDIGKSTVNVDANPDLRASDIKNKGAEFYSNFYGAVVTNYVSQNEYNQWKIFYADDEHFYLIASDYIEYTDELKGKGGNSFLQGNTTYNYKFGTSASDGVMHDYPNGTNEIINTKYATAEEIKALNSKYFNQYPEKHIESNKLAVASMLDTNVWKGYMDKEDLTGKAKYAIGGPTVEMLLDSYNQKYNLFNEHNMGKYQVDVPEEDNAGVGYKISTNYGIDGSWESSISSNYLSTSDTLFVSQDSTTNASGYWLASPSAYNDMYVVLVSCYGVIGNNGFSVESYGFRPIVCLKSDTILQITGENEYRIAN